MVSLLINSYSRSILHQGEFVQLLLQIARNILTRNSEILLLPQVKTSYFIWLSNASREIPLHIEDSLRLNSPQHYHVTRHSNTNSICPKYNRETEGCRTFVVVNYLPTMEQLKPKLGIAVSLEVWKFIILTRLIYLTRKFIQLYLFCIYTLYFWNLNSSKFQIVVY